MAGGAVNAPTQLIVTANLEETPWNDVPHNLELNPGDETGTIERFGVFPNGTTEGRCTVMMLVRFPDGRQGVVQTTLRVFRAGALALLATPHAQMDEL